MTLNPNPPQHFYSFDAVRGIAAIIVVLYHWQMFYYPNDVFTLDGYDKTNLPWFSVLSPLYLDGMVAVDLFFLLSGFIFFWLYADRISSKKMNFGKFMGFRLSRLYPIHLLTLLLVGGLQWIMLRNAGHFFVIQYNDAYHFFLNLLFMQNWGFEKGPSFNGPSWSVSAEVFLYLLFFVLCTLKLQKKKWLLILLVPLGAYIQFSLNVLGKGVFSFFYGGLIYYLYVWIMKENRVKKILPALTVITIFLWGYMFVEYYSSFILNIWLKTFGTAATGKDPSLVMKEWVFFRNQYFRTAVSPCTILTLVLWESTRNSISKRWSLLGNCSYAMYLIHFPLQIIFVLVVDMLQINRTIFHSPYMMLLFFAVLLPLSIMTYYYFELPAQEKIRSILFKPNKPNVSIADVKITT